jgi:hypothetical protein
MNTVLWYTLTCNHSSKGFTSSFFCNLAYLYCGTLLKAPAAAVPAAVLLLLLLPLASSPPLLLSTVWSGDTALEKLCRCCSSRRDIPPRAVILLSDIAAAADDLSPPRFVTPTVGVERADADDDVATVTSDRSVAGGCSDVTDPAVISTAVRGGPCRPARTSSLLE